MNGHDNDDSDDAKCVLTVLEYAFEQTCICSGNTQSSQLNVMIDESHKDSTDDSHSHVVCLSHMTSPSFLSRALIKLLLFIFHHRMLRSSLQFHHGPFVDRT